MVVVVVDVVDGLLDVVVLVVVESVVVDGVAATSREPDEPEQAASATASVTATSAAESRCGDRRAMRSFWPKSRPESRVWRGTSVRGNRDVSSLRRLS